LVILWFELRNLQLLGKALYCMIYTSSPLCSGYFLVKERLFVQAGLDGDPNILTFLLSLGW
jgi:hypothetical protein